MSFTTSDRPGKFTSFVNKEKNILGKIDAKKGEQTSFIFISDDVFTADYLMVIIHGTGVVRAGQWSRK